MQWIILLSMLREEIKMPIWIAGRLPQNWFHFFFDKQFYVSKYMCPVPIRVAPLRIMGATCLTVWERSYRDEKGEKWKEHCVSDHGRRRDVNSRFSTYGYKDIQMLCAHICVYMYPHGNIPKLWPKTRPGTSGFTMLLRMPSTLILALN